MDVIAIGVMQAVVIARGIWFLQRNISKHEEATQKREQEREDIEYKLLTAVNAAICVGGGYGKGGSADSRCSLQRGYDRDLRLLLRLSVILRLLK